MLGALFEIGQLMQTGFGASPLGAGLRLLPMIGFGAACVFAPVQAALLGAVRPAEHGQAAGAATAVRELGGVLGVAVLAGVFAAHGGGESQPAFLAGFGPALEAGAVAAAAGALVALAVPGRARRRRAALAAAPQPA
ncbi:MAG TPA: hypothetical protein VH418_13855 [Solirubrobacteraceae bacterium]